MHSQEYDWNPDFFDYEMAYVSNMIRFQIIRRTRSYQPGLADDSCDLADVDLMYVQGNLVAGVGTTIASEKFDLVHDSVINGQDITTWLAETAFQNGCGSPYRRGDSDGLESKSPAPRDVDITDFNSLAANFDPQGANAAGNLWDKGNFDGDDDIDITDFNFLATNFASTGYGTTNVVPEPSSAALCFFAMLGVSIAWGHHRLEMPLTLLCGDSCQPAVDW